jgi:N-acetyl-gamma-glutamyl-phosphate reductase
MNRVFIDGEAGTTGLQIRERLAGRRDIELIQLDDARRKDTRARAEALGAADVAILCLPDDAAREAVSLAANSDTRIIDASTAHRTAAGWTYGFPEMAPGQADAIAAARFVANPGCWPQGYIALVRPLVEAGLLPAGAGLSYSGVSGYSGGGRKMIEDYEAAGDAAPAFMPYGLTLRHKHLPEMLVHAGLAAAPVFLPAVIPVAQGMLTTVPLHLDQLASETTAARLHEALAARYRGGGFVDVAPLAAHERHADLDPRALNGTNDMRLHVFANDATGQVLLMAIYDNLGKGASGAAVQNLNLMLGADAALGLRAA